MWESDMLSITQAEFQYPRVLYFIPFYCIVQIYMDRYTRYYIAFRRRCGWMDDCLVDLLAACLNRWMDGYEQIDDVDITRNTTTTIQIQKKKNIKYYCSRFETYRRKMMMSSRSSRYRIEFEQQERSQMIICCFWFLVGNNSKNESRGRRANLLLTDVVTESLFAL